MCKKKSIMSYIIVFKSSTWNAITLTQPLKTYIQFKIQSWFTKLHTNNRRKRNWENGSQILLNVHSKQEKKLYKPEPTSSSQATPATELHCIFRRIDHCWAITKYYPHPPKEANHQKLLRVIFPAYVIYNTCKCLHGKNHGLCFFVFFFYLHNLFYDLV